MALCSTVLLTFSLRYDIYCKRAMRSTSATTSRDERTISKSSGKKFKFPSRIARGFKWCHKHRGSDNFVNDYKGEKRRGFSKS